MDQGQPCLTQIRHPALEGVVHSFFGCTGGVSKPPYASLNVSVCGNDDLSCVQENRRRAVAALCMDAPLLIPHQEHTACVATVVDPHSSLPDPTDALVTTCSGIILGISTADCGPVLFHDPVHHVIGAAHAGWRGALAGVLENTVNAMVALGAKRDTLIAVLGPMIAKEHYEVSLDLYTVFCKESPSYAAFFTPIPEKREKYLFDLPAFIVSRLQCLVGSAYTVGLDTFTGPFFSCRRSASLGETVFGCGLSAIML